MTQYSFGKAVMGNSFKITWTKWKGVNIIDKKVLFTEGETTLTAPNGHL